MQYSLISFVNHPWSPNDVTLDQEIEGLVLQSMLYQMMDFQGLTTFSFCIDVLIVDIALPTYLKIAICY